MSKGWLQRIRVPHVFTLLTGMVLLVSVLTWIIPSGQYERQSREVGGLTRNVVIPGSFEELPKHYSARGALLGD